MTGEKRPPRVVPPVRKRATSRRLMGARYHAVAEEGIPLREIAEAIGAGLSLPVESITPEEAPGYYGWLAPLAAQDLPASGALTRQQLSWNPIGPDLLTDPREAGYDAM